MSLVCEIENTKLTCKKRVNTYSDEGKTNATHEPDKCKVTGKLVNTDCLFAAPKNGLDLEGDNKQRDNSEEVQLFGITRQRRDY